MERGWSKGGKRKGKKFGRSNQRGIEKMINVSGGNRNKEEMQPRLDVSSFVGKGDVNRQFQPWRWHHTVRNGSTSPFDRLDPESKRGGVWGFENSWFY